MQINVLNPVFQTQLFAAILILGLILTSRRFSSPSIFSNSLTEELKGFAILTIIFGHIGYFLSSGSQFLFPLSILSGVGVNLFLFLSGLGLTLSQLHRPTSILSFYKKRALKLFLPLWIVITLLIILDYFFTHQSYSWQTMLSAYLGWYPEANLYINLDSPLWYFSFLLFYYLVFPWAFLLKKNLLPPLIILLFSYFYLKLPLPVTPDILKLYLLHTLAFPLGMVLGIIIHLGYLDNLRGYLQKLPLVNFVRALTILFLSIIAAYTAYHSEVGKGLREEQLISLLTTSVLVLLFMLKNIKFRLLNLFGKYSYEIYLLHWPLMYRFDVLYKNLPPFLATALYLGFFILLGMLLHRSSDLIFRGTKKLLIT
ncbi:MAG: acyltransferase family protein [bacterium]|nr:acyltransferase family protein [bacterium]